jgi:hypothetical protein
MDAQAPHCEHCGALLPAKTRGRPQRFCSDAHRQAHRKIASTHENGLRYRTHGPKPKRVSQQSDLARDFEPENLSQKTNLRFARINAVTFKLTDGEGTNVPASHGQWSGYRTTKALAWVIKLGSDAWLARCGDQVFNPSSFNEAKSQALAMARRAVGDYFVKNPIRELNELQAGLLYRDEDAASG